RASVMHVWPQADAIDMSSDLARNLHQVYIESWYAKFDTTCRLIFQNLLFNRYLLSSPYLDQRFSSNVFEFLTNQHTWGLLDEAQILDTFERIRLQPNSGTTSVLADREARYHDIEVEQGAVNVLSPFRFNCQPEENRLFLDQMENVSRLVVHAEDAGLETQRPLRIVLGPTQGSQPIEIAITGFRGLPSNVLRGTQATSWWSYDTTRKLIVLEANNPNNYRTWTIIP
ncbi:MAG: hypothetical protein MK291_08145, partial [Planctomycetes bacterium]|nr:hypothetical protein [Planctomycetota bacterium]